jgi:2-polyprenyl-6-methoxyphenol hydroxylase-like FAD-dependent oxidoreductase
MAGLLAARVLADAYEQVTVIDRDALPEGPDDRRAVPQGRHAHALLPGGQVCLERLLPGSMRELATAGAVPCRALEELRFIVGGHELARASTGAVSLFASRALFEWHVRLRVGAIANIALRERCDVPALTATPDGRRVTGVRVLPRADGAAEEVLPAQLVVAATGRAARVPAWLEGLGHVAPGEERVPVDVAYTSRHVRLAPGALGEDKVLLVTAVPGRPRALFLFPQEGGRHILSTGGYGPEHRPPGDHAGHAAFAASVAPRDLREAILAAEPVDEAVHHGFPASLRRRYDKLRRFPEGLLVCGDAICSFNPTYGQGMTVAAKEAVALLECLEEGDGALARRFFARTAQAVGDAWSLSTGSDLALPEVPGRRPAGVRVLNAYLARLRATASRDLAVAGSFAAVVGMLAPPRSLTAPRILARVAAPQPAP